jgi:hypothetical protein
VAAVEKGGVTISGLQGLGGVGKANLGKRSEAITHAEEALRIREQIDSPRAVMVRKQLAEWRAKNEKKNP